MMDDRNLNRFTSRDDIPSVAGLDEERIAQFLIEHLRNANLQGRGKAGQDAPDTEIRSNREFWLPILNERYRAYRWVKLINFQIIDWFPRTPGLYHTVRASMSRREARRYVREEAGFRFYEPRGKTHMMDGGIGAVRFKPMIIEGDECWLCTATSDEYCHTGVPVAIPNHIMARVELNKQFTITGQTRFLPEFLAHHFYHMTRIPQMYLLADSIEISGYSRESLQITPMVFFTGERRRQLEERGNVTFVTCRADSLLELDRAADWLDQYVGRYGGEIITNFDEQRPTFQHAPFSLQNVMNGRLDKARLQEFHIGKAEIVCESIQRIHAEAITMSRNEINIRDNATIHGDVIAATSIRNSFNKAALAEASTELKDMLKKLAVAVEKMNAALPKETAQQVARDLDILVVEATSPAPRKEWWQLSVEGLKKAAINVGEIGKPVLELAGMIVALLMSKPS
jgi:hypothetical protein